MLSEGQLHASSSAGDVEPDEWEQFGANASCVQAWAFSDDESLPLAEDDELPWDDKVRLIITDLVSSASWQ